MKQDMWNRTAELIILIGSRKPNICISYTFVKTVHVTGVFIFPFYGTLLLIKKCRNWSPSTLFFIQLEMYNTLLVARALFLIRVKKIII